MAQQQQSRDSDHDPVTEPVTAADVVRLCGRIDDAKLAAIVATHPSQAELEEAVAWLADEGEPLAKAARPLAGKAAIVYRILESEVREEDDPGRP